MQSAPDTQNSKKNWKRQKLKEEKNTINLIGIFMELTRTGINDTIKIRLIEGAYVSRRTLQGKTCRWRCGVVPCISTLLAGGDIHIQILED